MATLSTHVLDTARGRPAAGLRVAPGVRRRRDAGARPSPTHDGRVARPRARRLAAGDLPPALRHRRAGSPRGVDGFYPEVVVTFTVAGDDALPRAAAAQPLRLLDLPWQLSGSSPRPPGRRRRARGARSRCGSATAIVADVAPYDDGRRRRAEVVVLGRRRGAAARARRHPRARQRAGPHGVGGVRQRHPRGRRRRRHDDRRHAAQQHPADHRRWRRWRPSGPRPRARPASTSGSGAARCPATCADLEPLHEAGVFGFKCFLLDSGVEEFGAPVAGRARRARWPRPPGSGSLLLVHAEDGDVDRRRARTGRRTPGSSRSRRTRPRSARSTW